MSDTYTDTELLAMPRVNLALLDQTLDYIVEHPDEWDQTNWAKRVDCGTACCFAGTATVLSGHELGFDPGFSVTYLTTTGEDIEEVGQRELGLTRREASRLFLETLYPDRNYGIDVDVFCDEPAVIKAARLKAVKIEVERIRYRARLQEQAFARAAQQIGEANSKREVVREPQSVKVA